MKKRQQSKQAATAAKKAKDAGGSKARGPGGSSSTAAKKAKDAGGSKARGPGGSSSRGQFFEDQANARGMGYDTVPTNTVRVRVHVDDNSGEVIARMLVCSIRSINWIVCRDCGHVCTWSSSGKHQCPESPMTVTYDDSSPEVVSHEGKDI